MLIFTFIFALFGGLIIWHSLALRQSPVGDLNNDGMVGIQDLSILLSNYGTHNSTGDINDDGVVDVNDLSILLSHYNQTAMPDLQLSASPPSIPPGSSSTISWSATSSTSCSATDPAGWTSSTAISGSQSVSPATTTTYKMECIGPGGSDTKSVTVTVTGAAYLFDDEFNDPHANAPPDSRYWIPLTWHIAGSQTNVNNVFQDGNGNLVLRTRRDSNPTGFSGAWLNTFSWDGHPAGTIKVQVAPPFHVETRMRMSDVDGSWPGLWTNDATSPSTTNQPMLELDISEERTTFPTDGICHYHLWAAGSDLINGGGRTTISNMRTNWHVYWADVYADHAVIGVDGQTCGTMNYGNWTLPNGNKYRVTSQSFLYQNLIANPSDPGGNWASGGKQPPDGDPGPWDALVDYIRVNTL